MSNFHVIVQDIQGGHLKSESFDTMVESTAFAKHADKGGIFEIHTINPNDSHSFIRGIKKPNGHIDWKRVNY